MGENLEAAGEQRHRRGRLPIPGIRSEADQPFAARGGGGDEGSWRNFKLRESAKEKIFIERFHLARWSMKESIESLRSPPLDRSS